MGVGCSWNAPWEKQLKAGPPAFLIPWVTFGLHTRVEYSEFGGNVENDPHKKTSLTFFTTKLKGK